MSRNNESYIALEELCSVWETHENGSQTKKMLGKEVTFFGGLFDKMVPFLDSSNRNHCGLPTRAILNVKRDNRDVDAHTSCEERSSYCVVCEKIISQHEGY